MKQKLYLILMVFLVFFSYQALSLKLEVHCPTNVAPGQTFDCTLDADSSLAAVFGVQFSVTADGFSAGNPFFKANAPIGDVLNTALNKKIALFSMTQPNQKIGTIALVAGKKDGTYSVSLVDLKGQSGSTKLISTDFTSAVVVVGSSCTPACPKPEQVCLGITNTNDDRCGGKCNVVGTKTCDEVTPPSCVPTTTCLSESLRCGSITDDGCGNKLNCGICSASERCQQGQCVKETITAPVSELKQLGDGVQSAVSEEAHNQKVPAEKGKVKASLSLISKIAKLLRDFFGS